MAYIGVTSTTESKISVRLYGLDTSYEKSDRVCTWYLNGSWKGTSTLGGKVSSGGSFTFSGLSSGTEYNIDVSITAPGWSRVVELSTSATTDEPEIEPWSWSKSNGSASASQTSAAYSAINNRGKVSSFSYLVWNDMVNKVKEICDAKGWGWNSNFASYSETLMNSWDKTLTATRFNSLRYNIGIHYSTGINTVYRGDTVYGWYFTTLADCMNAMI